MTTTQVNNSNLYTQSNISLDWNGGYKLEVDISTQADTEGWELDFELPQGSTIRDAYSVELIELGNRYCNWI